MAEIAAFICRHIFAESRPVLLVSHADGDWQFLCGDGHDVGELPHVVGLNHLLDRDPSLEELVDLPVNWEAERTEVGAPWHRKSSR